MTELVIILLLIIVFREIDFRNFVNNHVREKIKEAIPQPTDFKISGDYTFIIYDEHGVAICCGVDAAIIEDDGVLMLAVHGLSFNDQNSNDDLLRIYRENKVVRIKFAHDGEDLCIENEIKIKSFSVEAPLNSPPIYEIDMNIERNLTMHEL